MAVVTRASKGSVLTHSEMDTNFEEINLKVNSTDMTTALDLKANLTSPTFIGTPTAPTPTAGDNSTKVATTEFVNSEIAGDVGVANSSLVKTALNASGSAPIYACRAWVNFNGTGTVAIRASGNVSSITDNGTGDYTVNFTTAMVDANYTASLSGGKPGNADDQGLLMCANASRGVGSIRVSARNGNAYYDYLECYVAIFR
jgi:hypothetical protein